MVDSNDNQDLEVLAQRIARRGAVLPGTRPFWSDASRKLKAQIRDPNCKSPHLFFTVSAADIQWPDLHQHMPASPGTPPQDEQEAYRIRMTNLNNNPAIAAYYFQKRWQIFYQEVVQPQLDVVDYWWRFEWQHRGSSHIHGFLWLRHAPPVEDLKLDDDQSVHQFVTFWDRLVSTWNPMPTHRPAPIHPSSRPFTTLSDTQQELVELINRVQRHAKCSSYCLRRDKTTREEVCRFRFPQDLRELTELVQKEGESLEFLTKRNDHYLNSYNPTWILGWRANMDFRPVLSPHAAISYISKYVSKAETQSKSYQDILRNVAGQTNDNARVAVVYQKMLSSFVGERDISGECLFNLSSTIANVTLAQEVCHTLFGCPMWVSSRQYRSVKVSEGTSDEVVFNQRPGSTPFYERYVGRPDALDNISLYEFYQWYEVRSDEYKRRGARGAKPYVVDVWPRFSGSPADAATYEKFCRAKVFLHHPHRTFDEILHHSGIQDWTTFYQYCKDTCDPPHWDNPDPLPGTVEEEPESDTESIEMSDDEDELFQDAWMEEAGRAPNAPVGGDISRLGQRDIDEQHPWTQSDWTEEEIAVACDWMDSQKRLGGNPTNQPAGVDWRLLQGEQKEVFLQVIAWYKAILGAEQGRNDLPEPLRINIDGTAGTGKSFLISAISTELLNLASQENKPNPVIRLAPTGIAAFGISGMTIHSALSLPVKASFNPLITSALGKFQHQWKYIKLLIVDEKSMIGRTMAGMMDSRLRQILTDEVMGGVGVLLFGDFAQLPPVGDSPLYSSKAPQKPLQISGREAYLSFNQSITLQQIFRQQGDDPVSQQFRDLLLRQRTYSITQEDFDLLSTRFSTHVSAEEKGTFRDAIHLFPTRASVEGHNHHYLEATHAPVLRCKARHHGGRHAKQGTEDQADGLEAELLLAIGARVMLTRNVWTGQGTCFTPHRLLPH